MPLQTGLLIAVTGNSFILLGVLIILVFAIAYGLYTAQGSGINKHPRGDSQDPIVDDSVDDQGAGVDRTQSGEMDQRGTE